MSDTQENGGRRGVAPDGRAWSIVPVWDRILLQTSTVPDERGCINWTGTLNPEGYAAIGVAGRKTTAHRVVFSLKHGDIPAGKLVRHKCDNRRCVNIDHLEIGTHADNVADMWSRGRSPNKAGEDCPTAKLTDRQVADAIRSVLAGESRASVARRLGVHETTVGKYFKHRSRVKAWRMVIETNGDEAREIFDALPPLGRYGVPA